MTNNPPSGTVYLIHFDKPYLRAGHYIGWTSLAVEERVKRHMGTDGAALLRHLNKVGIGWKVVKTWPDRTREFERSLKNYKKARAFCPVCSVKPKER